ncbi:thioredoxin [Candidatus Roizmanbacteria bacterium]|nr:thioredoxin [Candidatus Roizmanbacteria bacterium]
MPVAHLSKDTFTSEVINKKGVVFVDFYAEWCGPCKMTAPVIEQLATEQKDITFYKVDVDQNSELASQYSVFSIPTFVIFKDGQIAAQFSGAMGKEGFTSEIKRVLGE